MSVRVLVVEDDPTVREVLVTLLGFDGYEVLTAADGPAGLVLAQETHPDVVVLDLMLPGMDGLEVCRTIKKAMPDQRVVMVTAKATYDDELAGIAAGADAYLRKPFSPLQLIDAVGAGSSGEVTA